MKYERLGALSVLLFLILVGTVYAATLTPQQITTSGLVITPVAATDTDNKFSNDGRQFLMIQNGSGETLYYTVTVPGKVGGYQLSDLTGSVISGTTMYIGPFNPTYVNASDGTVGFTISVTSSVNLAVLGLR